MRSDAVPVPESLAERVHRLLLAEEHDEVGVAGVDLRTRVEVLARSEAPLLGRAELEGVVAAVASRAQGLGPLDPLLADPLVSEVMVNGPGPVWIEREGRLVRLGIRLDAAEIEQLIERVVAPLGLRVDRSSPLVDARLPDGSRVNAVLPPLAVDGPCLTIRRFAVRSVPLTDVATPGVAALLAWAVRARCNIVVSGGTGAGKTTLLNGLAAEIPADQRVLTVEDTAELALPGAHVVRLESRPPNAEGVGGVSVRALVRNALRMRPDRIVVGECRGEEALDMLQAMNTGHEGSLSTCHANSPVDALRRLETMVLAGAVALPVAVVRDQIEAAVDFVVQVARSADGARRVVEVAEVVGPAVAEDDDRRRHGRTRRLAGTTGLHALPTRPLRDPAAGGPQQAWLDGSVVAS